MANFIEKLTKEADFTTNNLLNITQPPEFILKILIIQSRDNIKSAIEHYYIQKTNGVSPSISHIKGRIIGLYLEVREAFNEYLEETKRSPEEFEKELTETKDFKVLYRIRNELDTFLYKKRLIKFDNIINARPGDLAEHNRLRGYD